MVEYKMGITQEELDLILAGLSDDGKISEEAEKAILARIKEGKEKVEKFLEETDPNADIETSEVSSKKRTTTKKETTTTTTQAFQNTTAATGTTAGTTAATGTTAAPETTAATTTAAPETTATTTAAETPAQ